MPFCRFPTLGHQRATRAYAWRTAVESSKRLCRCHTRSTAAHKTIEACAFALAVCTFTYVYTFWPQQRCCQRRRLTHIFRMSICIRRTIHAKLVVRRAKGGSACWWLWWRSHDDSKPAASAANACGTFACARVCLSIHEIIREPCAREIQKSIIYHFASVSLGVRCARGNSSLNTI